MNSTRGIGARGEALICGLLPLSVNVGNLGRPHDIEWNDIKIDVKATTRVQDTCTFTVKSANVHEKIILVYVAFGEDRNFFWVERYSKHPRRSLKLKDSIDESQLLEAILDTAGTPPNRILKDTRSTTIQISKATIRRFDKLREITKKRRSYRILPKEDFLIQLMDEHETRENPVTEGTIAYQTGKNYER